MSHSETNSTAKTRLAWRAGYLIASLGIYLMDQASKAWAVRRLRFEDRTIIRGTLDLVTPAPPDAFAVVELEYVLPHQA